MCELAAQRSTANSSSGPVICAGDGLRDGGEACAGRFAPEKYPFGTTVTVYRALALANWFPGSHVPEATLSPEKAALLDRISRFVHADFLLLGSSEREFFVRLSRV